MKLKNSVLREEAGDVADSGTGDNAANADTPPDEETPWYSNAGFSEETLADDGVKGLLGKYKTPDDFAKGAANLSKKVGEKGLSIPGEDATDEERAEFYTKLGRPESPDKYSWEMPEGFEMDQEWYAEKSKEMFDKGISDDAHSLIMDLYRQDRERINELAQNHQDELVAKTEPALREEWKEDYDANMKQSMEVAERFGVKELLKDYGIINELPVIKMLHEVALSTTEGKVEPSSGFTSSKEELASLKNDPAYMDRTHPNHKNVLKRVVELSGISAS